jgi:peptidoglycan/LPS O-acetylase OafA/YrhL
MTSAPARPSTEHSTLLDNWRGWAIIFVLLGHFFEPRGANLGRLGVELFFVLSGRLMADLLFIKQVELPKFFYRRASRVLPVSLLFIATAFIVFPPGVNHLYKFTALASAAMVVNYTQLIGVGSAVTGHYWSLCVEEHSYIALGLVAWLLRRHGRSSGQWPAVACLVLATLMVLNGWRLWHERPDYYAVYWRSDVRAATIFMSVGLRILFARGLPEAWRAPWIPVVALLAGLALNTNHVPDPIKYSAGSLLIALSINSLDQVYAFVRRLLSSRSVAWFGLVSYSVYIWQQPFYYSIDRYGALPMLAGAIATGAAVFYLYERPLRAWLNARRAPSEGLVLAK